MAIIIPVTVTIQPPPLVNALARGLQPDSVPVVFPNTLKRLMELAQVGVALWRERALKIPGNEGRPLRLGTGPADPMVRLNQQEYANSIALSPVTVGANGLEAVIGTADRQAIPIEIGGPLIDLHAVLRYAPKAYKSKKGHRYLLVPFRFSTNPKGTSKGARFQSNANVLDPRVLAIMRNKRPSLVTGHRNEPSVNYPGKQTQRNIYNGSRDKLTGKDLLVAGIDPSSSQGKRLLGLMRIGKARHGGYITIRTLSEANPKGWRVQPYPAQRLANQTAEQLQALATTWFEDALKIDAANWVEASQIA